MSELKKATIGTIVQSDSGIWTANIDFPDHFRAIEINQELKSDAEKIRKVVLKALHEYGVDKTESWRERNRQRQAAGVKFEKKFADGSWKPYAGKNFIESEERYREVPQLLPHAAERALWKAQREVGTNEVWQGKGIKIEVWQGKGIKIVTDWFDLDAVAEPPWHPDFTYRVKPMKLTAKIVRWAYGSIVQDWEFYGTPEEYRAECEKYGYAVVSEIKEVVEKPKTVKFYMAMVTTPDSPLRSVPGVYADCGFSPSPCIGSIPEPSTYALFGLGLGILIWRVRHGRHENQF